MTQEEKRELVFKDISARAPYYPIVSFMVHWEDDPDPHIRFRQVWEDEELVPYILHDIYQQGGNWEYIKPYLRPMSSMTEEEKKEYKHLVAFSGNPIGAANFVDWLNKNHFDYHGLIEKGLALEASDDMYN